MTTSRRNAPPLRQWPGCVTLLSVRTSDRRDGLTVQAIAGNHVVLLGFSTERSADPVTEPLMGPGDRHQ